MSYSRYCILITFVLIAPKVSSGSAVAMALFCLVFAVIAAICEGKQK